MISLLLVLSIFVSTGVLWELRDTGITMVNDAQCGLEEHTHTDECYQDVLICGLEENEEHTHTAECYERRLVCGYDEHIHDLSCYGIEKELIDEETDDEIFALSGSFEGYDDEAEEELLVTDMPSLTLDNEFNVLAKHNETATPGTISTIDNIAEGIKFTLFDYGDSNLESQNNNYNYRQYRDDDNNWHVITPYEHNDVRTTGINIDRNFEQDILFLAYGTPVPYGANYGNIYNYSDENGRHYQPDMNSYSGDYGNGHLYSGNRPVSGIVDTTLTNGYPTINASEHHSLAYLFDENELTDSNGEKYKTVYTDVNHLLEKKNNGHLVYDSDDHYAYYNQDTHDFTVYDSTYHIINKDHHLQNDVNNLVYDDDGNPIQYGSDNGYEMQIGFFPFDQYDWTRRDPNFNGNGFNHHFGMKMEAQFINPEPGDMVGQDPVIFSYSGDDDMWVFVDGKLVLDIGGIHEPTAGMIDFTNGLVWVQDDAQGQSASELSQYSSSTFPKPMNYDNPSHKWIVTPITQYLGNDWNNTTDHKHEIKMFYLERGGCYSNLAMDMNLPTLKPLSVQKTVDYQQHLVKDPAIDNKDYEFQVWEWDTTNGVWVIPQSSNAEQPFYLPDNHFYLKDGQRKTFENLGQNRKFKVVEVGVDPNIYDRVSVNGGTPTELKRGGASVDVSSSETPVPLSDTNSYIFNNRVIEDPPVSITVKKNWVDPDNKKPANFTMKYRIMRTDSLTGEVKQVALKDPVTGKKTRTFLLPPDKQVAGDTISGLLSRYGNHVYSYRVEELNVPMGFNASYSETTDGSGNKTLQVTNTDMSKVDIYVKKEWENAADPKPNVKLVLKRERVGYSASQETDLKVRIVDEGGNLIKEKTITGLYANGSAEIECDLPEGVVAYTYDSNYLTKSPSQLYAKYEDDENILVVRDLAAKTGSDVANEVTIKVTSGNAEDSLLLLHHSFTRGPNGWGVQNDPSKQGDNLATVGTSGYNPYAKGDALLINNRQKCFNGATLHLDPDKFKANKTYTFSTYVYYTGDSAPDSVQFNFTFNDGLNKPNNGSFRGISSKSVSKGVWTQLTGTITLPTEIDPYNMFIIVETANPNSDSNASNYEAPLISQFRMDEFTAIEGSNSVEVEPTTGVVKIDAGGTTTETLGNELFNYDMENWGSKGWYRSGEPTLSPKNTENGHAVVIEDRAHSYDGIDKEISDPIPGGKYRLAANVSGHRNYQNGTGAGNHTINFIIKYTRNGSSETQETISSVTTTGDEWKLINTTFELPNDLDTSKRVTVGFAANGTGADSEFEVWTCRSNEISVTTTQGITGDKAGYKFENGQYVSDYSNYSIDLDPNSVTNPLHLNGTYETENWSREITLSTQGNEYDGWGYHWNKSALGEENGYLYRYWVEEVKIGNDNVTTSVRVAGDDKIVESSHDDYIISYDRQFVATNTEDSPILVKNKYIWYKLPATGGRGTTGIYVLGAVLTTFGILSGCTAYRRRRRRE